MACDSYNQWFVISSLYQFGLYQNLILIIVVDPHSLYVLLLLSDELSDLFGGLVPVHLRHIAVHENDPVESPMLHPELFSQLHRFFTRDYPVNPLVVTVHDIVWHLYLVYLFRV